MDAQTEKKMIDLFQSNTVYKEGFELGVKHSGCKCPELEALKQPLEKALTEFYIAMLKHDQECSNV